MALPLFVIIDKQHRISSFLHYQAFSGLLLKSHLLVCHSTQMHLHIISHQVRTTNPKLSPDGRRRGLAQHLETAIIIFSANLAFFALVKRTTTSGLRCEIEREQTNTNVIILRFFIYKSLQPDYLFLIGGVFGGRMEGCVYGRYAMVFWASLLSSLSSVQRLEVSYNQCIT
jgi:hypothetical protein